MIDLEKGVVIQNGLSFKITGWAVKFLTIRGYHETLSEALKNAKETEMPVEMIRPISCAIAEDDVWEPIHT